MNYHAAIKAKYPKAEFELRDDGEGVYFYSWKDKAKMPDITDFLEVAEKLAEIHFKGIEGKKYLEKTDWLIVRHYETNGKSKVPDLVKQNREACRKDIETARVHGFDI